MHSEPHAIASLGDSRVAADEPFGVSPKRTCILLDCGMTHVYALLGAGELESYLEGRHRKITMRSIRARIARLLAESNQGRAAETAPNETRAA